eukprot:GFUD01008510.1.p1 GENE.GFUD01008510.1~~GFUD01008510.1.p1  ORF type:complete len:594 (-),score=190.10 GFUD01008510.1:973-2754(-)
MGDDITENFPNWNYGTTLGGQGQHGGYTEYKDEGSYGNHGYGFTGPRGGGFGGRGGRCPLPSQEDIMPQEVAGQVAKEEQLMEQMPGVIIKNDDGSLMKVVDPNTPLPMPDVRPEPTRFDKSVHGILNGRNAAMFVNIECKKRCWDIEFEEVDAEGPVHDRTYSYTLTVGPPDSEDVTVTAGIAKSKKDAKKRCCEAMVLKLDDLPAAPPLHMQPHMMGRGFNRFPGPGRFMRGFPGPRGFPGGFRPRLPPPESEETIFKKYDKTPNAPHPSQNHPISKLCERSKKYGWPQPVWDMVNEKVIDTKKHKHGRHNTMLYTFKVTVYPGKGQVEPKVYFGSGPTKKDAKFACGSVAWADQDGCFPMQGRPNTEHQESLSAGMAAPILDPEALKNDPAQLAVQAEAEVNKPKKRAGDKITESRWLDIVAKDVEKQQDVREMAETVGPRPPTQLIKRVIPEVKTEIKTEEPVEAEEGEIKDERSRSKSTEMDVRSRSKSRREERSKSKRERSRSCRDRDDRSRSHRDRDNRSSSKSHRDHYNRDEGRFHRDDRDREERKSSHGERGISRDGYRDYYDRPGPSSSHRDRERGNRGRSYY